MSRGAPRAPFLRKLCESHLSLIAGVWYSASSGRIPRGDRGVWTGVAWYEPDR